MTEIVIKNLIQYISYYLSLESEIILMLHRINTDYDFYFGACITYITDMQQTYIFQYNFQSGKLTFQQ